LSAVKAIQRPKTGGGTDLIDQKRALAALPNRPIGAHKWGVGGLVIVAGSPGYGGAAILSTMAAGRAGAGIVTVALPRSLTGVLAMQVPEAITIPLPDSDSAGSGQRAAEMIGAKLDRSRAILIGPGLGDDESTDYLLSALFDAPTSRRAAIGFGSQGSDPAQVTRGESILTEHELPVVIDADGLNWLSAQSNWWDLLPPGRIVLTPHLGELERLTGTAAETLSEDPVTAAKDAAARWGQTVVFKYGYTVVTDGKQVLIAEDAPTSLATAGSGDVLAGTIGAFLAQGVAPIEAAALAVYTGFRAARRVEAELGTLGLVASDLPRAIAAELGELERTKEQAGD
jgi:NAD(P)H-hydrate epimerase